MDSNGRNQREAVNVIFRILTLFVEDRLSEVPDLILRAESLDKSNVNANLIKAISKYLDDNGSAKSTTELFQIAKDTPFESALKGYQRLEKY